MRLTKIPHVMTTDRDPTGLQGDDRDGERLLLGLSGISTCQCCRLAVTPGNTTVKHDNIFRYSFQIPSSSL
jgi:hypothetical protein